MDNYKKLKIWQNAMETSVEVYNLTNDFPESAKFNLSSQIRRSAVSIPSNLAEGAGRSSNSDFNRLLGIAQGSCYELHTQLIISNRLNLINEEEFETLDNKLDELEIPKIALEMSLLSKI